MWQQYLLVGGFALLGYLLGGIMFGKIFSKIKSQDVSNVGSGNPGATNMIRNHGFIFGALTFFCDALKGAIPTLVAYFVLGGAGGGQIAQIALYLTGLCAVLGHCYPVYYKFKGGKGVSTSAGVAFVAVPWVALVCVIAYIIMLIIFRVGSVSSLLAVLAYLIASVIVLALNANYIGIAAICFLVILIFVKHIPNIKRIIAKSEATINFKEVLEKDKGTINKLKKKSVDKNIDNN